MRAKGIAAAALAVVAVVLLAGPAAAQFDTNDIGCAGQATIARKGKAPLVIKAGDREAAIPRRAKTAEYEGVIETTTHNHSGRIVLKAQPSDITIGDWGPSANSSDIDRDRGTKKIPSWVKQLPPGRYVVSGYHQGDEGRCSGDIVLELKGNPLSSTAGIAVVVLTLATAGGLAVVALPRGPF